MRTVFEQELIDVTDKVITMANEVNIMLHDAIEALQYKNLDLASEIIKRDDIIDEQELIIEDLCIHIIATQCPIASDLRRITTILKIISDLERIADHSVNISKVVLDNQGRNFMKPLVDLPKMQKLCSEMIGDVIEAFVIEDHKKALRIIKKDDEVDRLYEGIYQELLNMLSVTEQQALPVNKEQVIMLLLIGRYLERIADHTTNVAERIIYMVTGKMI